MKLLVILLLTKMIIMSNGTLLEIIKEWKFVEYKWPSEEIKQHAIDSGDYNVTRCVLYDVDKAKDGRIFVTSVREKGVPATLMTVSDKMGEGGPLLIPYPNWSWHTKNKKTNTFPIVSVYRVDILCNYLFVLDCGKIGDLKVQDPQLLIFDLTCNKMVKRVKIPDNVATNKNGIGLLVTPIVSFDANLQNCRNILNKVVIFMADTEGFGLVVWQACNNKFCRFESNYMKPTNFNFTIVGESFMLNDGILGMTNMGKDLLYAPLSGNDIYKMKKYSLTNKCSLSLNETDQLTRTVVELSGQTGPIASYKCSVFFSNVPETSILCANSKRNSTGLGPLYLLLRNVCFHNDVDHTVQGCADSACGIKRRVHSEYLSFDLHMSLEVMIKVHMAYDPNKRNVFVVVKILFSVIVYRNRPIFPT